MWKRKRETGGRRKGVKVEEKVGGNEEVEIRRGWTNRGLRLERGMSVWSSWRGIEKELVVIIKAMRQAREGAVEREISFDRTIGNRGLKKLSRIFEVRWRVDHESLFLATFCILWRGILHRLYIF
jgi:hypothetical protein